MNDSDNDITPEETPESSNECRCDGSMSPFLPITILALSFILILVWNAKNGNSESTSLQQGITTREPLVQQSTQVQTGLQKLVMDLFEVSKTDDDAKALITKFGIQIAGQQAGTAGAPQASPSASPAK